MSAPARCAAWSRAAEASSSAAREVKNEVSAVLQRNLKGRPPASDLFGRKGRTWLAAQQLPADERLTVDAALRGARLPRRGAGGDRSPRGGRGRRRRAGAPPAHHPRRGRDHRRDAARRDRRRPPLPELSSPGRVPGTAPQGASIRQRAGPPHGRLSKQGSAAARHVLVEAGPSSSQRASPRSPSCSSGRRPTSPPSPPSRSSTGGRSGPTTRRSASTGRSAAGRTWSASSRTGMPSSGWSAWCSPSSMTSGPWAAAT